MSDEALALASAVPSTGASAVAKGKALEALELAQSSQICVNECRLKLKAASAAEEEAKTEMMVLENPEEKNE